MSQVLIDPSSLTAIGEAIRSKNKQTVKYKPNEMAGAIKALALDNSVTIQSNDAWKYAIDSTLEHQSITVKVSGKLTGDNTSGYRGEVIFDPYITSNFGWIAGKITKTVDNTNHVVTFSAEPATEISGVLKDGWTPVYVVDGKYYTTTTPDNIESFKRAYSSDNIENLLICGYYTIDESTNKLVATEPTTYDSMNPFPCSNTATKKIRDNYMTTISNGFESGYNTNDALEELYLPNLTSISNSGIYGLKNLKVLHIPNIETISRSSLIDNGVSSYYLPKLKIVPNTLKASRGQKSMTIYLKDVTSLASGILIRDGLALTFIIDNETPPEFKDTFIDYSPTILVPNSAVDAYKNKTSSIHVVAISPTGSRSSVIIKSMDDYNININQENSQITVTKKITPKTIKFSVKNTDTSVNATVINNDNSKSTIYICAYDIDTGECSYFGVSRNNALLALDTYYCKEAINILKTPSNLKLKITRSDNSGGIFEKSEYSEGQEYTGSKGSYTEDDINFTSYAQGDPGCSLADLATAYENGETLNCEIEIE